jgi:tetratricopeptide (TPR) repeat protein
MSGPTRGEIYFKLHKHALSDRDAELAMAFAEKAVKEDSNNYDYTYAVLNARLASSNNPPLLTTIYEDVERAFLCDPTRRETYDFIVPLLFQNKIPEAITWIDRALISFPDDPFFLNIAGAYYMNICLDVKKARKYFQKCLSIDPTSPEYHFNCGLTYTQNLEFLTDLEDKSIWHFKMALCYKPNWKEAKQSLVGAFTKQSRFKEALAISSDGDVVIDALHLESRWRSGDMKNIDYDELISRITDDKSILGSILKNQTGYFEAIGDYERAEKCYRHIYDNRDDYFPKDGFMWVDCALGTGHFLCKIGNWEEGAPKIVESETKNHPQKRDYPLWEGEDTDHLVILNNDLGNGDQMFYARYIPLVATKAKRITLVVAPRIKHMYSNIDAKIEVTTDIPKEASAWIECSYLVKYFGPVPMWDFLPAPPPSKSTGKALIHLSSSKTNPLLNYRRDVPFEVAVPLLNSNAYTWVSVAKQNGEHPNLTDLSETVDKGRDAFIDTMKILQEVDIVVTCDTFMVHLAGLLKRPTILVITSLTEFRWGSPMYEYKWYPTVEYIRQDKWADWSGMDEILLNKVKSFSALGNEVLNST